MLRRVRVLFVLLALVILAAGTVEASPGTGPKPMTGSVGVLERLWDWLSHLLPGGNPVDGGLASAWEADGSHLDPNGNS